MYNSPSEYLIAETEKFLGKGLTSEERAKVNTAIRNIGKQLSEVDRYNWKEKLPEIAKNNLGGVAVCLASSIVRQGFESQKLQNWASGILDKWKWADKARIEKSAFRPQGHSTIIWDMAEKFIEMTSKKEQNLSDFYSCDTVHDPRYGEPHYDVNFSDEVLSKDLGFEVPSNELLTRRSFNSATPWEEDQITTFGRVAQLHHGWRVSATQYRFKTEDDRKAYLADLEATRAIRQSHRKETSQSDDKSRKDDYLSERVEHYLKEKDFRLAYFYAGNADRSTTPLDMMKEVVKMYGTDTKTILNAVSTLTEVEGETPDFTAKLLQDTMKTDEYKKAFDKEQGQSKTANYAQ